MIASNENSNKVANIGIGIIGCGWLGTALAKQLQNIHHPVKATTGSIESAETLNKQGIDAQVLPLPLTDSSSIQLDVFNMHTVVVCIPPRFKQGLTNYPEKISNVVALAEKHRVQHLIMVSSTAIYNGLSGTVDENTTLNFYANKVQLMHDAEQEILAFKGQKSILRLSGLVGPNRHPSRFLSANKVHKNGTHDINLIHQSDAVGLIIALVKQSQLDVHDIGDSKSGNEHIYNGVSDTNSTRKVFYQYAAKVLDLPIPQFETEQTLAGSALSSSKKVLGIKAVEELNYNYIHTNLLTWMNESAL